MSTDNHNPEWLGQVQQFTTGADHGKADIITDPAAVGAALGAIADAMPAGEPQAKPLSMGEQLKLNAAAKVERERTAAHDKQVREEQQNKAEISQVRAFFNAAWGQFTSNIGHGLEPGVVTLGGRDHREASMLLSTYQWQLQWGSRWQDSGKGIWNQPSKFSRQWAEFLEGCRENGLEPVWNYAHDGVGVESWWELTVEPYEPAAAVSVDAALGGILDEIGQKLVRSGLEDASGARRLIHDALEQGNFALAARMLGTDVTWVRALWSRHNKGRPA